MLVAHVRIHPASLRRLFLPSSRCAWIWPLYILLRERRGSWNRSWGNSQSLDKLDTLHVASACFRVKDDVCTHFSNRSSSHLSVFSVALILTHYVSTVDFILRFPFRLCSMLPQLTCVITRTNSRHSWICQPPGARIRVKTNRAALELCNISALCQRFFNCSFSAISETRAELE